MPSDASVVKDTGTEGHEGVEVDALLDRLEPALRRFRSAVAEAAEEVRIYRARHAELAADPAGRMTRELGPFAHGRIDPLRLAGLLGAGDSVDPLADRVMAVAHERFLVASSGGVGSYRLTVPEGADLRDAVKEGLAEVGRVFATARAVEKARQKRYQPDRDHTLLHPHPFHRWSPAERSLAPPLVVEVAGAGLRGAGLLEFMEGGQKFVLLVRGPAPPAPLARLASPGVFVAQVQGEDGLELVARFAVHEGPGVLAVFEEGAGAVTFVHPGDGGVELDAAELRVAGQTAGGIPGKPGLLDLRYLVGLMAATTMVPAMAMGADPRAAVTTPPASSVAAHAPVTSGAASAGIHPAPAAGAGDVRAQPASAASVGPAQVPPGEDPSVDQLADWLLARTDPAAD